MKFLLLFFAISFFPRVSSFAQTEKMLTVEQQINDLKELETKVRLIHPSLYRFSTPEQIDSIFSSVRSTIKDPVLPENFYQNISPIFSCIRDAHTWQQPPQPADLNRQLIPFDFRISDSQLFVYNNCSKNDDLKPGTIVLKINNEKTEDIVARLKKKISVDGYIETTKERAVEEWFKYLFSTTEESVIITYRRKNKIKSASVKLLSQKDIDSLRLSRTENNIEKKPGPLGTPPYMDFKFSKANDFGIITIKWFAMIPWDDYKAFIDSSIQTLNTNHSKNLIIDLRWNIGGPREYPIYLLSKIFDHPYNYCKSLITTRYTFDEKIPADSSKVFVSLKDNLYGVVANARGMGIQQPFDNPFKGNVFLIVNGQSNSSSAQIASLLNHYKRGVVIGEEPGGLYEGGTGENHYYLTLQHSQIKVQIPRYRIVLDVDKTIFKGHGVTPDFPVTVDIQKVIKGEDNILEFAIGLTLKK